jgi:hypothetical protein
MGGSLGGSLKFPQTLNNIYTPDFCIKFQLPKSFFFLNENHEYFGLFFKKINS